MLNLQCLQRGVKILFFTFLLIITNYSVFAQKQKTINLPDYDEAWLHYGFIIAGHTSTYRLNYNDAFVGDIENTAINPTNNVGFTLGFLLNLRVSQFLDLRVTPQVSFYENNLDFIFRSAQDNRREVVERTTVEVPILLKYKSVRRGNHRMYVVGGIKPAIDATRREEEGVGDQNRLLLNNTNLSLDYGVGVDIYYPLFKFSPEIRFSHGLIDVLIPNDFSTNFSRLTTHSITLYLNFE